MQSLNVMRDAIDKFHADNGRYPDQLDDLVEQRYIRAVPVDPVTESADDVDRDRAAADASAKGGVYDVRSGAEGKARDGVEFAEL